MPRLAGCPVRSVIGASVAGGVLLCSARLARSASVSADEERFFRRFNDAPDELHGAAWVVMQSGSLGGAYVAAAELARRHRPRTAAAAAIAGTAVWTGVKLVKPLVGRGRPQEHLDDVTVRGQPQSGLGYPSGHAAVAITLALIAPRRPSPSAQVAAIIFGGVIGATRMYVGAHLPLDVAGGMAIGLLAGQATTLARSVCR